jgi:signal transduction histidine kinase
MKREHHPGRLFALTRRFGLVSLAAILITTGALAALSRELSIRAVVAFGQQENVNVAQVALETMLPELAEYLRTKEAASAQVTIADVPPRLRTLVEETVRNTSVERIKIYNRNGILLYSTMEHEIGTNDSANPRFRQSIGGTVSSRLLYRDAFNIFGAVSDDDNLIETYVPVRKPDSAGPIGVFEIYTDANSIVRAMSQTGLLILAGIVLIMVALYAFLFFVVRQAEKIIADQRHTILERSRTLEILSARMLHAEEEERGRIARELHEEIAQTLSAAKIKVDALAQTAAQLQSMSGTTRNSEILPLLQSAIEEVRDIAMDMRPPSLDEFGLLATTRSLCRETAQLRGQGAITADLALSEEDIPDPLKSIIFRITQQTLKRLAQIPDVGDIRIALKRDEELHLTIDFSLASAETVNDERSLPPVEEERPTEDFRERAVLSGGSFSAAYTDTGRFQYQATWAL